MDRRKITVTALAIAGLLLPAMTLAADGKPLKTGQDVSYGAAGDTTAGLSRSCVDNGLGFVKDQRTGLMWEKKDRSGGIHDVSSLFSWSDHADGQADGTVFTDLLATLNSPPCYASYCDWRLPTRLELSTIVDLGVVGGASSPMVDPAFDTDCIAGCTIDLCSCTDTSTGGSYWTSTTYAPSDTSAWMIIFTEGRPAAYSKTGSLHARAVRNFYEPEP
jgi:Protein of unknown function (DUF1566)